jgi:Fe-S oxidoreductase
VAMAALVGVGFFFAGRTVYWLLRYVGWGEGSIEWGNIPKRIKGFLVYVIGQRKVIAEPGGLTHLFIFWGFLILQLETIEYMARGFAPEFHFSALVGLGGYNTLLFAQDLFGALVFIAISIAFIRRFIVRPKHVVVSADSAIILALIAGLMVTKFLANGGEIAFAAASYFESGAAAGWSTEALSNAQALIAGHTGSLSSQEVSNAIAKIGHDPAWTPFASWFALGMLGLFETASGWIFATHHINYWLHIAIVIGFANYIPFGKHLHLIGAMPNVFFKKHEPKGSLSHIDMGDESIMEFGAKNVEDLEWKQLLDSYACTECARCEAYCPAYNTGKPLNPYMIIHKIKDTLKDRGEKVVREGEDLEDLELPDLTGDIITKEELWACTTCGACVEACPVFIEHVDSIVDMRRYLALMEADFPQEVNRTFRNMEKKANPWGISSSYRADWADDMGIPLMSELSEPPEYLFWVGCAGSFDDRQKKVTQSFAQIMEAADISFAILGPEESCTGDPARRIGNEHLYWMLAQENIETLDEYGVTKIVTTCPHCFHTIGKEYPQLGGDYEVIHHTELLNQILRDGDIQLGSVGALDVTYHDSCYIGRWDESYENPRNVLRSVPGVNLQEMDLNKEQSFCCGAGGGRMWMEEDIGKRVNVERTDQALSTDPDAVAVNCPFCMTMFEDGLKSRDADDVPLKDLAEIVAENLEEEESETPESEPMPPAAAE